MSREIHPYTLLYITRDKAQVDIFGLFVEFIWGLAKYVVSSQRINKKNKKNEKD